MNQDDIFKLLLIVLLITNERGNGHHYDGRGTLFSSLNEIIILALLLNVFTCRPARDCDCDDRSRRDFCEDGCGDNGNGRRRAAQDGCC